MQPIDRTFIIKSLYDWDSNIYFHSKNKALDALESNKPVTFQLVDPTNYGAHIRAVVDNQPIYLTKKQIRWSVIPLYLYPPDGYRKPKISFKAGNHNLPVEG